MFAEIWVGSMALILSAMPAMPLTDTLLMFICALTAFLTTSGIACLIFWMGLSWFSTRYEVLSSTCCAMLVILPFLVGADSKSRLLFGLLYGPVKAFLSLCRMVGSR